MLSVGRRPRSPYFSFSANWNMNLNSKIFIVCSLPVKLSAALKDHCQNSPLSMCPCDKVSKEISAQRCHVQVILERAMLKEKDICSCKGMSVQKETVTLFLSCADKCLQTSEMERTIALQLCQCEAVSCSSWPVRARNVMGFFFLWNLWAVFS